MSMKEQNSIVNENVLNLTFKIGKLKQNINAFYADLPSFYL